MIRRQAREVKIGNICIGGNQKIAIQSMLNVASYDIENNILQAKMLKDAGCDIIRVAIPDEGAVKLITKIKERVDIALVADIHFNYKLAIKSVLAGADKIRINPGNIGSESNIKKVVDICKSHNIPIRIGVNSGSIDKQILSKYNGFCVEAMVESAILNVRLLERFDFEDIVLSLKCSGVKETVSCYRMISQKVGYPLHLGVTESGPYSSGIVKSSVGIGSLLLDGIGDTIRVSLTSDPLDEVDIAKKILKCTGHLNKGVEIISCPTCGRTKINILKIAHRLEKELSNVDKNLKIAVMGCVVNGPGEAKEADIGIAGGDGFALLFKKGEVIKRVAEKDIIDELIAEVKLL